MVGEQALHELASRQGGVVSRQQADKAIGIERLKSLLKTKRWLLCMPSVYRSAGAPYTRDQELWAAILWAGPNAVISHRSAAQIHGLDGVGREPRVELTVPRSSNPKNDRVVVHRSNELSAKDFSLHRGMPVTHVVRTLIDLAGQLNERQLEHAFESAIRRRPQVLGWLSQRLAVLGQGRGGAQTLAKLINLRDGAAEPDSTLEVDLNRLLRAARLPRPVRYIVADGRFRIADVDFAWPEKKLVLETDGFSTHSTRRSFEDDRWRRSRLAALGWRVLMITYRQVQERPNEVVEMIRRALGDSGAADGLELGVWR